MTDNAFLFRLVFRGVKKLCGADEKVKKGRGRG